MLASSVSSILERLKDGDTVLDIGAWARPFVRADWVMDRMPYETRGLYGHEGEGPERFDASRWIRRDICARDPYPFDDDELDFVICSHTLEDVRDPVWVCSEMSRIGKAGYIEVPSRLVEQSFGVQGPWVGWGHHHWLVDVSDRHIEFVFKPHVIHGRASDHFPARFYARLPADDRVQSLWWNGSFAYRERVLMGPDEVNPYVADFVARERAKRPLPWARRRARLKRMLKPWAGVVSPER